MNQTDESLKNLRKNSTQLSYSTQSSHADGNSGQASAQVIDQNHSFYLHISDVSCYLD